MAEFVELRMEEMVPIFEKIRQTNLIKESKLKKIIADIRENELNIQRPARTLHDFFNYFNYLKGVLEKLKIGREKLNYYHHTVEIEDQLKTIITSRFGMANHNFKHELEFWLFRLRFMKDMNWLEYVSNLFTQATKLLGNKHPELWIDASNFEWTKAPETSKGIESARQFVQLGLRKHPNVPSLYIQGFHLELSYINFIRQNPEEKEKLLEHENGKEIVNNFILAKSFYNQAKKLCHQEGPQLYQAFYIKAKFFQFTKKLCAEILEDMRTDFHGEELAYDILAKLALAEGNGKLFRSDIDKCIEAYDEGLASRPTITMYDKYISTLSFLTNQLQSPEKIELESKLLKLFERANQNWKLSEQNYLNWYRIVKSIEEDNTRVHQHSLDHTSSQIFQIISSKFPTNSQILQEKLMNDLIENNDGVESLKVLKDLNKLKQKHPKEDTTNIWLGVFINTTLQPEVKPEDCEKLIRSAPRFVQGKLSLLFIKFFGCVDMNTARAFYDQNFTNSRNPLDFHLDMARLESSTLCDSANKEIILARICQCYENATEYFGRTEIEPWLAYINFERERRNVSKSSTIYNRALQQLSTDLKEEFILAEKQRYGKQKN